MKLTELPVELETLLTEFHGATADHANAQDELKTMIGYVQTAVAAIESFPQKVAALSAGKEAAGQKLLAGIHAHLANVVATAAAAPAAEPAATPAAAAPVTAAAPAAVAGS